MSSPGLVAVIISTFNEEAYVERCLGAVLSQTVSPRVVVVDGGSVDGTVDRLRRIAASDERLVVIADGERRSLPAALNLAIDGCRETYIAKVDARTFIAPDFLERALDVFQREGADVACAGGRPEQFGETHFGEGLARARMSRFGVGGSGYADSRTSADVDTVQCGVYRSEALRAVGGFDASLQFGEDEELNWRLRRAGHRIVVDTSIRIRYLARSSWLAAFRQYRNYGRARARVVEKHPEFLRGRHLAPSAAILTATCLLLTAPSSITARAAACSLAALYAGGAAMAATIATRDRLRLWPHTTAAFAALHAGYGIGVLEGFLARVRRSFA